MIVAGAGVDLAVTDHGGDGPAMLLTHGFGGDQTNLMPVVRRLLGAFRVVTFDLRNHGASGDAPWSWADVVADFAAVRDAFGFARPIVAGHSLGGMVSEMFAVEHPNTRCVVNIDGHGRGAPSQYIGLDEETVRERQQRLVDWQVEMTPAEPPPRPGLDEVSAMMPLFDALDMFSVHTTVQCPLLIFNAHGNDPIGGLPGMEWAGELMRAYRTGLAADLDKLADARPNVEIAHVEATHHLIYGQAQFVADRIIAFVGQN